MLLPTAGPRQSLGQEARAAADMAVAEANASAQSPRFAVRVRPEDGPWGTQAREAAALVYDDGCCVLVAALDGRATHVVEQVVTKAQIPLITPWASEDTVTQAGVSWVYRCVPNDRDQLRALLAAASEHGRPVALVEDSFDGRMARQTLERVAAKAGHSLALVAQVPATDAERRRLASRVSSCGAGAALLLGGGEGPAAILPALRRVAPELPVYASLATCNPRFLAAVGDAARDLRVPWPADAADQALGEFARRCRARWGDPTPMAAFVYDAVSLVLAAIRERGPSRAGVQDFLSQAAWDGVTGTLAFDDAGNREATLTVRAVPPLLSRRARDDSAR